MSLSDAESEFRPVVLPPQPRDITHAHAFLVTIEGEQLEDGPMHCNDVGEWVYELKSPGDARLGHAAVFIVGIGAPHVNA